MLCLWGDIYPNPINMKQLYIIVFALLSFSIYGQTKINKTTKDTIVDFWNLRFYDRLYNYDNRVVESNGKILYVKISYKGQSQANLEYFRINDSLFHCIEYYPSSNQKAHGDYIISNKIVPDTDTLFVENIDVPGEITQINYFFRQILKTGEWVESSDYCCIDKNGNYWEGKYQNGKRKGIWKHLIRNINGDIELERVNYDIGN